MMGDTNQWTNNKIGALVFICKAKEIAGINYDEDLKEIEKLRNEIHG